MDGGEGIILFSHGTKCLVRLVVALHSLRQHYSGRIAVLETGEPDAADAIQQIAADSRLDVQVIPIPLVRLRKHSCYVTKATLWRYTPFDVTLFMDADTLTVGDVRPLLKMGAERLVVTAFSHWRCQSKNIAKRLEGWRDVASERFDVGRLIDQCMILNPPAVNTGVFAWPAGHPLMPEWEQLTFEGRRLFIADELAMQLLLPRCSHVFVNDAWNCSPIYGHHQSEAVIWHFHGHKETRREEGRRLWEPEYILCRDKNIGGIRDWAGRMI